MIITELSNESWPTAIMWSKFAERAANAALAQTPYAALATSSARIEVAIRLTDNCEIQNLNRGHRGKDTPTNVLSFPMFEPEDINTLEASPMPEILLGDIMPLVQYYAYIEITQGEPQNLWMEYEKVRAASPQFAMRKIQTPADIYPVFRDLFKKAVSNA